MKSDVKKKFDSYPAHVKPKMESLRKLILETARNTDGAGEIEETIKWGEPAYLASQTKSGTTIRIDWKPKLPDRIGMYVSCNTNLVASFRALFPGELEFEGKRGILIPLDKNLPEEQLKICIKMAMRYHLDKKNQ